MRQDSNGSLLNGRARKLSPNFLFKKIERNGTVTNSLSCSASRPAISNSSVIDAAISGALNSARLNSSLRLRKPRMVS